MEVVIMIKSDKIDYIYVLKGLAMLLVIIVHSPQCISGIDPILIQLTRVGRWGCQLFLVLSGFLLALSWNKKEVNLKRYYWSRFISIAPAYYIAIIWYILLCALFGAFHNEDFFYLFNINPKTVIMNILLLHGLSSDSFNFVVPGGWYIGTQWILYLVFPLIIFLYNRIKIRYKISILIPNVTLIISFFIQFLMLTITKNTELSKLGSFFHYSFINQLPCFMLGFYLYYNYVLNKFCNISLQKVIFRFLTYGLVATLTFYGLRNIPLVFTIIPYIYSLCFVNLFIIICKLYDSWSENCFCKFLYKLGKVSYAAYFTNFIFGMFIPWFIFKMTNISVDGTICYFIMVIPIIVGTYFSAKLFNIVIAYMGKKLKFRYQYRNIDPKSLI